MATAIILLIVALATFNTVLSKPLLNHVDFRGEEVNMKGDDESEVQFVCDLYPKCLRTGLICCPMSTQPVIGIELG